MARLTLKPMKGFSFAAALAISLGAPGRCELPSDSACQEAEARLEDALKALPAPACKIDADCVAYRLRPDPCAPPVILARRAYDRALKEELQGLRLDARRACVPEFGSRPSCETAPPAAACLERRCVDRAVADAASAKAWAGHHFNYARFEPTCAPWDGPAMSFIFSEADPGCGEIKGPAWSVNINRNLPGGPTEVSIKPGDDSASANRCLSPGNCEISSSGELSIEDFQTEKSASGRVRLRFRNGPVVEGRFKARWCRRTLICG